MAKHNPHITPDKRERPSYAAYLHICDKLGMGHEFVLEHSIDVEAAWEASGVWSSTERAMIRIALDLYHRFSVQRLEARPVTFGDAVEMLDSTQFRAVLEAMQIARGVPAATFALK